MISRSLSLRAAVQGLAKRDPTPQAAIFNSALGEVLKIIDQHEQERQRRSAEKLEQLQQEGKRVGGDLPYGFSLAVDGVTLCEHPGEQRAIKLARQLRAEGLSLRKIARKLLTKGMIPREGDEFHATQIKRMTDGTDEET